MINIENIALGYEESCILNNISIQLMQGKLVGVVGRNGVGKTTLLKGIMGIIKPMSGTIHINKQELTKAPIETRAHCHISYIPQGREIFSTLTVEENILLGFEGNNKTNKKERIASILSLFPVLKEMYKRKGGDLSGGQQQQLAFARALVATPHYLLLDEPTEGIQPSIVQLIQDSILQLVKNENIGILLVEHNLSFLLKHADYLYVIDRGKIVLEGTPSILDEETLHQHLTV